MSKSNKTQILTLALILLLSIITINADVPQVINYQGRLTDGSGDPVTDGMYLIRFNLYDAASSGTSLWESQYRSIQVTDGFFSYLMGDTVAIPGSIFANYTDVWLGIKVSSDPEMSPRSKISSAGFAFKSLHSDTAKLAENSELLDNNPPSYYLDWNNQTNIPAGFADGIDNEGTSGGGDITAVLPGSGLTGGGTSGDVTLSVGTGAITTAHLGYNSVTSDKIPDDEITGDDIAHNTLETFHLQDGTLTFIKMAQNGATNGQVMKLVGGVWMARDDESGVMGVTNGQGISITGSPEYPIFALQNGGIYSEHIANSQITDVHILNNTIQFEDIGSNGAADGQVMKMVGSSWTASDVGDITSVTTSEPGGLTGGSSQGDVDISIATGGVTSNFIQNSTIVNADISPSADIATTKIHGEAVNLIDAQTVEGAKTFEDLNISTTTRRLSISNAAFVPRISSQGFSRTGNYIQNSSAGFASFYAQVSLPEGAVVTKVKATYYDAEASYFGNMELFKVYMYTSAEIKMAGIMTNTSSGLTNINTTAITSSSISNNSYNYYLISTMGYNTIASNMRLYGAEIEYTITKPLP